MGIERQRQGQEEDEEIKSLNDHDDDVNDDESEKADENVDENLGVPVDGGWAWIILTASTVIIIFYAGTFKSFGVFFIEIISTFHASVSTTSLIPSLQFVTYCLTVVPVLTSVIQRYSVRTCQVIGIVLSAVGYAISSYVPTLELLILSQSVLCGLGHGFILSTSIVLLGKYFKRRLGLANGILMSGYCLGGISLPPLIRYLVDTYALRGALLLTSGIILNTLVPALLLRPVTYFTNKNKLLHKRGSKSSPSPSNESLNIKTITTENAGSNKSLEICHNVHNKEILVEANTPGMRNILQSNQTLHRLPLSSLKDPHYFDEQPEKEFLQKPKTKPHSDGLACNRTVDSDCIEMKALSSANTSDFHHLSIIDSVSQSSIVRYLNSGELISVSKADIRWSKESNMHIDLKSKPIGVLKRATLFLRSCRLFNKDIWSNKLFYLVLVMYSFGSIGPESYHIFVPAFAKDENLNDSTITIIISIMNISDFFGRIFSGFLADNSWIKRHQIVLGSQLILGILCAVAEVLKSKLSIILFAIGYGSCAGVIFSLTPTILVNVLGKENFPTGVAISIVIKGSIMGFAVPFLGFLRDYTRTYHASFYFMGCASFAVVLSLCVFQLMSSKQDSNGRKDVKDEVKV